MLLEELTNLKVTTLLGVVNRALARGDKVTVVVHDETGREPGTYDLHHLSQMDDPMPAVRGTPSKVAEMGWKDGKTVMTAPLNMWELHNSTLTKDDKGGLVLTVPYGPRQRMED